MKSIITILFIVGLPIFLVAQTEQKWEVETQGGYEYNYFKYEFLGDLIEPSWFLHTQIQLVLVFKENHDACLLYTSDAADD